ncbi:YbaK/prolyl-tRNA synthetase associated domain-containing protein, partial [Salmonella enterica subsp. enterica serovar Typhimurium]
AISAEFAFHADFLFGAVPPFSFHHHPKLAADPLLLERFDSISFNVGLLVNSVIMDPQDYLRISRPDLAFFRRFHSSPTA